VTIFCSIETNFSPTVYISSLIIYKFDFVNDIQFYYITLNAQGTVLYPNNLHFLYTLTIWKFDLVKDIQFYYINFNTQGTWLMWYVKYLHKVYNLFHIFKYIQLDKKLHCQIKTQ
jgi:hypothetical protein